MKIKWTRSAAEDLEKIEEYLAEKNPIAAIEQILTILDQVEQHLTIFPKIGRSGRIGETRELVITNTKFIVMYLIEKDFIYILRVIHGARKWPSDEY